jgi:Ca2+-transporting ATPase
VADSTTPVRDNPPPVESFLAHTLSAEAVASQLHTDPVSGLDPGEIARRLEEFGPNKLEEKPKTPPWKIFLGQFQDFMIYVLIVAVIISAIEGQVPEAIAILAILLLNGVLGFVQEYRAEQSLDALKELSAPTATVVRAGDEIEVPAAELVPGDLVLIEAGDRIPADGRLVEVGALRMNESALTGESEPARKDPADISDVDAALGDRRNIVFAGTSVAVGRGRYIVTGTGRATEMGRIADLLAETEEGETPLQKELEVVGRRIALLVLAIAAIVFAEEVFLAFRALGVDPTNAFSDPELRVKLTEALLIAVSLAVAAIPEGLPAVVTMALSLGVRRMAAEHAIVRRLHSVETLGSTTFICSDKTGTLTVNRMTVRALVVGEAEAEVTADGTVTASHDVAVDPDALALTLRIAASCNDAHYDADGTLLGDPTETALVEAAGLLTPGYTAPQRIGEVPFDSERKRMTTVHTVDGARVAYVKGGADVVIGLCRAALLDGAEVVLDDARIAALHERNARLASRGYRTLAVAYRVLDADEPAEGEQLERDLVYVGILGLVDPARPKVPDAIEACHRAGIKVAMVTGDHALTARAIATQIGLMGDERVVTGAQIAAMNDEELAAEVEDIRVFARVNPEDKLRIVEALKRNGEVVAMTGDGVNDAPALKRADIGVAMGLVGTDVARESADMVLTDDNFSTIVSAVKQGRIVFDNLRKVILFLLSCNMSEVLIVFITALLSPTPALAPLQLLWINLVTDGPPALALGVDEGSSRVMERDPRQADESIITASRQIEIFVQGALMTVAGLIVFLGAGRLYPVYGDAEMARAQMSTMLFTTMVLVQKLHAFSFLSSTRTVFSLESLRNRWLNIAFVATVGLQIGLVYFKPAEELFGTVPLTGAEWVAIVAAVILPTILIDRTKVWFTSRRLRGVQE